MTSGIATRQQQRRAAFEARKRKIGEIIKRVAPKLAAAEENAGLDESGLSAILAQMANEEGLTNTRESRRALDELLRSLQKKTGGAVALPPPMITVQRKASPFRPETFRWIPKLSELIDVFLRDVSKIQEATDEIFAQQIVFSAIVFGGLLNLKLLKALPTALKSGFQAHDGHFWIEITLPTKEDDDSAVQRRWFPDPLSMSLCVQWQLQKRTWPNGAAGEPKALMWQFFTRLGKRSLFSRKEHPFGSLLAVANSRLRMYLPGILVDFLQSSSHGTSLPPRAWWRLCADYRLEAAPSKEAEEERLADQRPAAFEVPVGSQTEHGQHTGEDLGAVEKLKRCLKDPRKGKEHLFLGNADALKALDQIRKNLPAHGAMFEALIDWSEWQLGKASSGKRRIRPSSLYRYLNSFAKKLIVYAGEIDPEKCSARLLEAAYRQVLLAVASDERANAVARLRSFHQFLMFTREVDVVEIDGATTGKNVRANIVSEHEYQRALTMIDQTYRKSNDLRSWQMNRAILIVAYRLGPRKISELAHLRLGDLQNAGNIFARRPLLWIHAHPEAALKTGDSLRRLPIALLLTREEREELLKWIAFRQRECGSSRALHALVFCKKGQGTEALVDRDFDYIVATLRRVCGDDSVVFHTLRHSFLCNLFVRLFIAEFNSLFGRDSECAWLLDDKKGKDLLKRLFRSRVLPREAAYLLAALAGHIDPDESMHSYVHLQDWISGLFLRECLPTLKLSAWAALEGISTEALAVRHSRQKSRSVSEVLPHLDTPQRLVAALKVARPAGKFASDTPVDPVPETDRFAALRSIPIEGACSLLAMAAQRMTPSAREYLSGVDHKTYQRMVDIAIRFASVPTATRNEGARRSRMLSPRSKRKRPDLSRLPQLDGFAPAVPRPRADRADARTAYRLALEDGTKVTEDDLWFLVRRTSHSDPIILVHALKDAARAASILRNLGIPQRRLRLEVRSRPRSIDDRRKWHIWTYSTVPGKSGFQRNSVVAAQDYASVPASIKKYKEGRLAIHVLADNTHSSTRLDSRSANAAKGRLAYGWRVGCYYALCIRRTMHSETKS